MSNLLVTGGAGFIGTNFVHYWLDKHRNDQVVLLDALTYAGKIANLTVVENNSNYHFVHGSIGDQELVADLLRTHQIDIIFQKPQP